MEFGNVYDDRQRAEAYAQLEFPGTYYLAFRDLHDIILEHVRGKSAIDFGCGTGRSTRFLKKLGFHAIGVDIADDMLKKAREKDPQGDYRLVQEGALDQFQSHNCDLVLSAHAFDNIPTLALKVSICSEIARVLKGDGRFINLVASPEIYTHEWASFTTKDFPENKTAQSGDRVRYIMNDVEDQRPMEDIIWADDAYQDVFQRAGLEIVKTHKPLANDSEPFRWINETSIAPWVIYVLKRAA